MSKLPIPGRGPPEHKILYLPESMGPDTGISWDDQLTFNTQGSSQWDSLCHFQHQPTGLAYNGFKTTKDSLAAASTSASKDAPTLDHWHQRGGLVARGVLIDYKAYTEDKGISFHAFDGTSITPDDLEACAAHQGVEFRPGDLLIVRTGATEVLESITLEQMAQMPGPFAIAGMEGSENTARWLWNKRFSAVAGDSNSFEVFPPVKPDGTKGHAADLGKPCFSRFQNRTRMADSLQFFTNISSVSSGCLSASSGISVDLLCIAETRRDIPSW